MTNSWAINERIGECAAGHKCCYLVEFSGEQGVRYACQACGAVFSRMTQWFGGELKCRVCHAKYAKKMTFVSFLFIGPLAWFSVWLGIWNKNPLGIVVFLVSCIGYEYFCIIQKKMECDDFLDRK